MTSKPSKRPRDANKLAKSIVDAATGDQPEPSAKQVRASKGGKAGGPARARALTQEEKTEIARSAASARWKKRD